MSETTDLSRPSNERDLLQENHIPDETSLKYMLKLVAPMVATNISFTVMQFVDRVMVSRLGTTALAATSAVFSCMNVSFMPVVGVGTALTAAVGKTIGKGKKEVANKQTRVCLRVGLFYMGLVGLCFFVFREGLMGFWSSDDKVIESGVRILICAAIFQVFDAASIIYSGSLRGAGDTVWLAVVSVIGASLILGLGGYGMIRFFPELGALGPWMAATVNVIAVGLANRWRFKSKRWMQIDLFKRRAGRD